MASNTYFVAGITGNVGGATARGLLAAGNKVRTLLRDPAKPSAAAWAARGVDVRAGDLADGDALAVALHGVAGAYVMNAPSFTSNTVEAHAFAASFEHALLAAHPPRVVALSSVGAEKASGTGLIGASHVLEQGLRKLAHAIPVAFVRAGSFYENNAWALGVAGATGFFDTFWTPLDRPYASVATADIGAEVARLLTGAPWTGAKTVELGTGASSNQIAAALAAALGKPVVARGIPREHWAAAIQGMGVPAGLTGPMEVRGTAHVCQLHGWAVRLSERLCWTRAAAGGSARNESSSDFFPAGALEGSLATLDPSAAPRRQHSTQSCRAGSRSAIRARRSFPRRRRRHSSSRSWPRSRVLAARASHSLPVSEGAAAPGGAIDARLETAVSLRL